MLCLLGLRVARYTLIFLLLWLWAGDGLRWRAGVLDCNGVLLLHCFRLFFWVWVWFAMPVVSARGGMDMRAWT